MSDIKKANFNNQHFQTKVFTRWVSKELKSFPNSQKINDITKDLSDGVALVELAQALTHKKVPRDFESQPKTDDQKINNCKIALNMFNDKNIFKIYGISPSDITANNEKQIDSLIWQLISHFSIESAFKNSKENGLIENKLLSWAIQKTQTYQNVFDFKPYDLAMCALLDSYYPSKIKYYVIDLKDHQKNFKLMMDVMKELGIPCIIYPDDFAQNFWKIDQKALLAQLSIVHTFLEVKPHMRKTCHSDSLIQKKFDSKIRPMSPQSIAKINAEKKLMIDTENLIQKQIQARRKAKSEMRTKKEISDFNEKKVPVAKEDVKPIHKEKEKIEQNKKLIKKVTKKNQSQIEKVTCVPSTKKFERKISSNKKLIRKVQKDQNKSQQPIEKEQTSEEFKENKEACNERKQKMKMNENKLLDEKEKIEKQISEEFKENAEEFNERKQEEKIEKQKANQPTKEQIEIQKEISDELNENKEAFNERKQEEKIEEQKQERLEEPIEHQISEEFKENAEEFNERKQEEKIAEQKANQPTKEQLEIEKEISEEFEENKEAFNKRKQEEKIEKEKEEKEEKEKEGIKYTIDNRPEWRS